MGGVGGWATLMLLDELESGSGEVVDTAYRYGGSILHCGIIDLLVCSFPSFLRVCVDKARFTSSARFVVPSPLFFFPSFLHKIFLANEGR